MNDDSAPPPYFQFPTDHHKQRPVPFYTPSSQVYPVGQEFFLPPPPHQPTVSSHSASNTAQSSVHPCSIPSSSSGVFVYPTAHMESSHSVGHGQQVPAVANGYYQTQPNYQAEIRRIQPKNPGLQRSMEQVCKIIFVIAIILAVLFVLLFVVGVIVVLANLRGVEESMNSSSITVNPMVPINPRHPECGVLEEYKECSSKCEPTCEKPSPNCQGGCGWPKCQCSKWLVRDNKTNECMSRYQCPNYFGL